MSVSGNLYDFIHHLWLSEAPVGELQWRNHSFLDLLPYEAISSMFGDLDLSGWISYPWFLLKLDGYFLLVGSFSWKPWICFSIIETLGIVNVALSVGCFFRGHHIVWVLPRLSQMFLHLCSHTDFTYVQDKHDMYVMVTCIFAMKVNCKVLKIFPQF